MFLPILFRLRGPKSAENTEMTGFVSTRHTRKIQWSCESEFSDVKGGKLVSGGVLERRTLLFPDASTGTLHPPADWRNPQRQANIVAVR
jgi:hypothetical protein